MSTPSDRVTHRAQQFLADQDVILALRVDWAPDAVSSRQRFGYAFWARAYLWSPIVLPIMVLFRLPKRLRRRDDPSRGAGILALTADGGRILLETPLVGRTVPTRMIDVFPQGAPLKVEVDVWEADMIPILTVGGRQFVVNGVDFRALLKAVEDRKLTSPEIKAVMSRLQEVGRNPYGRVPG